MSANKTSLRSGQDSRARSLAALSRTMALQAAFEYILINDRSKLQRCTPQVESIY